LALNPGTRLGPYEITAPLGVGGMGEVYRATDTNLKRQVAIKVLPASVAGDTERLARFQREAEVLAALNHPNIAHIHGLEKSDGTIALVMELVEGPTLADRIAKGAIPIDEVLPIAKQIAEALEAAHEQGIIHRDLKPANIKVRDDGTVKVLDFGLAKAMDPVGVSSASLSISPTITSPAMTQAGIILGTAAYMAPEQARGKAVDRRADIWAFGCVLFEMLTGEQLFHGTDLTETIASVVKEQPDLTRVPPHLRRLLSKCLEKDPQKRLRDLGDAWDLIEEPRAQATTTSGAAPSQPFWRRVITIAAAAIVFSAIAAAAVWRVRTPPAQPVIKFAIELPPGQVFTRGPSISVSSDGKRVLYVADQQIYERNMDDMESRAIPGTKVDPYRPFFSPDGQWIGYFSFADGTLKKIPIAGGSAITLCKVQGANPFGAFWYHDQIVFADPAKGILRVSENGGEPSVLIETKPPEVADGPRFLDDDTLLFTITSESGASRWDKAQIVVQSLRSGQRNVLVRGATGVGLAGRRLFYAVGNTVFAVPFDPNKREASAGGVPVVNGVTRVTNPQVQSGLAGFALSGTGTMVSVPGGVASSLSPFELVLIDRSGKAEPLPLPPQPYQHPRISPDGRQLAVSTDDGKESVVWIYDLKGGAALRQLTFGGRNLFPVWTPDSRSVTFQSDREGDPGIFQQLADGTKPAERLLRAEGGAVYAPETWTSDGKTLIYRVSTGTGSSSSLWTFTPGGSSSQLFEKKTAFGEANASLSPKGQWLAYTVLPTGAPPHVFIQPFPPTGSIFEVPGAIGTSPRWSPDGAQIFFDDGPSTQRLMVIDVRASTGLNFGTAKPIQMVGMIKTSAIDRPYDIAPDGKIIIVMDARTTNVSTGISRAGINVVVNWGEELETKAPVK
jgi:serine/threonine-protein kinase